MEIPNFLLKMSEQINTQDNRITADPVWQVRCKRTRPTASDYSDHYQIMDTESEHHIVADNHKGDINEDIIKYLIEHERMEFVTSWAEDIDDEVTEECEQVSLFSARFDDSYQELPEGFEKIYIEEYEDVIKGAFLTEADANWFIQRKQHDYPPLYTYVESMCFCPQMIELRNWIKSLSESKTQN